MADAAGDDLAQTRGIHPEGAADPDPGYFWPDGMVRVTLAKPFTLNGKKYGPGEAVVPKDAWHVWKSCI